MPYYLNPVKVGTELVSSFGDGYTINIKWFQAYTNQTSHNIMYHIYFSTIKDQVFHEGVKYVSCDGSLEANIIDLTPGQNYFFAIRPVSYNSNIFNPLDLPIAYDALRFYPSSLLRQNMTETDLIVPLLDTEGFPALGTVIVGAELIQYWAVDHVNNNLILNDLSQRGYNNSTIRQHDINGFDGYYYQNPSVRLFTRGEDSRYDRIFACESRFEYPNHQFTINDGYHQVIKDNLATDLSAADSANIDFPMYDYAGYHRTDPVQLLNGACVGSYIGGEMGCIDKYGNVQILRGLSFQDHSIQRQEILLSVTGRPAVLIKRVHTGITCSCYQPSSEYPDDRCPFCSGSKFLIGFEQYFNPRRADGRILVRTNPTEENTKMYESGLESEFPLSLWTLTVPTLKTRDIIILFDQDDNEEFRYEITNVTRNNTTLGQQGGQLFRAIRIRKTDPAYQIRVFRDTSMFPSNLTTTIGMAANIPPHTHNVVISEKTSSLNQINQITSIVQGHSHSIVNGVIMPTVGHDHRIIL
jgi:hypothetical protein